MGGNRENDYRLNICLDLLKNISQKSHVNELQLTLILAWYYFDKSNNVESFARRFNQYFEKDYSAQTILFSSAKFKNVDPANNLRQATPDERYKTLWDKYIVGDRIRELKELYREFKKRAFRMRTDAAEEDEIDIIKAAQAYGLLYDSELLTLSRDFLNSTW